MKAAVIGLGIVLLVAQPIAAQTPSIERPTLKEGDTWTYRRGGDTFSFVVRAATSSGYVVEELDKTGHHKNTNHWDQDLLWKEAVFFHPQWPLTVGKQWSFEYSNTASNQVGGINTWTITETVVGMESITVPAGTFQAIHIRGKQCNRTQQDSCGDFDVWYAPEVKYTVKIGWAGSRCWSSTDPRELVSYKVSP